MHLQSTKTVTLLLTHTHTKRGTSEAYTTEANELFIFRWSLLSFRTHGCYNLFIPPRGKCHYLSESEAVNVVDKKKTVELSTYSGWEISSP